GLRGGQPGARGKNVVVTEKGKRGKEEKNSEEEAPGKFTRSLEAGDVLSIQTPGGGGWGDPNPQ
ncbi:MAG: hydantoinase B/oxoprolinase family protein, partial [Anaerolineales bacterium]